MSATSTVVVTGTIYVEWSGDIDNDVEFDIALGKAVDALSEVGFSLGSVEHVEHPGEHSYDEEE